MKRILLLSFMLIGLITSAWAQQTVSGKVTASADGSALPGVAVRVKNTTSGVVTNIDGGYRLEVPSNGILVFSYIGYVTVEIPVGDRTVINVQLTEDIKQLQEVVVTGYSSETRDRIAGSVSTVKAAEIEMVPIASFDQILQGRSPGLYITAGSGQPGAPARVRIRGNGSINGGNQPLYILDGVPIEAGVFATLNPNDFENVSVLKDASATAVYGSRAANGVIVITTKKGKSGDAVVNYRFQQGYATQARERFTMMNTEEKLAFEQLIGAGPSLSWTAEQLATNSQINTNWRDVFIRTGKTQTHEVNISGGSDKARYYTSLGYLNQEGQALRSDLERYTLRMNLDVNATNKLRFGINTGIGFSKTNNIESEGGIALANPFAAAYLANPYERPRDPETGDFITGAGLTGSNAYERIFKTTNSRNEVKGVGSVFAEYALLANLTAKATMGVDFRQRDFERWIDPNSFGGLAVANGNQGSMSNTFARNFSYVSTNTLNYAQGFGKHDVSAITGFEVIEEMYSAFNYTGFGINPKLPETPAGITPGSASGFIPTVGGSKTANSLYSTFAIANYTYDGKYTLKASVRRDGSSRFGAENRYATLWSLGGAWNVWKENFMSESTLFSDLKLRASYGETGNQEGIGNFQSLATYGTVSYGGTQGIRPVGIGNPALQWEISNQANVGLDLGLWKNRFTMNLDVYNNITSNLFVTRQLSRTSGFTSIQANDGKVRNRGIELGLSGDVIQTNNLTVNLYGNIAYNDNEILDLGQVDEFEQGTSIIRVGLPIGSHYMVKWAGVNPANGEPLYYDKEGNVTNVYSAANSVAEFGTFNPPTTGGFGSNIGFKGLSLNVFFTFAQGYSRFNNQLFFQQNPNFAIYNLDRKMLTMWQQPGDVTEIASYQYNREFSSYDIEDASYLRLRNVMLSYQVPGNLVQQSRVLNSARVFVQGQNLFTWTKFTGFDPEDDNNIAQYEYPASRVFTFGLDVRF